MFVNGGKCLSITMSVFDISGKSTETRNEYNYVHCYPSCWTTNYSSNIYINYALQNSLLYTSSKDCLQFIKSILKSIFYAQYVQKTEANIGSRIIQKGDLKLLVSDYRIFHVYTDTRE